MPSINSEFPCGPHSYTEGRGGKDVEYIVVHYTGGEGNARQNAMYFNGDPGNASAHLFVDGSHVVYLSVPISDTAWAVGNLDMNQRSVSIEVCSNGEDFTPDEVSDLTWCVQRLMSDYGVPAGRVIRHHDCFDVAMTDGKGAGSWIDPRKDCPAPYIDDSKWRALWETITGSDGAGIEDESQCLVAVDGFWGSETTRALQRLFGTPEDGVVSHQFVGDHQPALTTGWEWDETLGGSTLIRAMQTELGTGSGMVTVVDGLIGPGTIAKLQEHFGTVVDGELWANSPCVRAMQEAINNGTF